MKELILPFKPFTLNEVSQISGASAKAIDHWSKAVLKMKMGAGVTGLDYMSTFAVIVGWRYINEGAGTARSDAVVAFIGSLDHDHMLREFSNGFSFAVPAKKMLVKPPKLVIGHRLDLRPIYREFRENLGKVFPVGGEDRPHLG